MRYVAFACAMACAVALAACQGRARNEPIAVADFRADYGYGRSLPITRRLGDTLLVLTFSGGGTRAAAFAEGVLRELEATPIAGSDRRLLDEIAIISSVSGGSVAAANFALNGRAGFALIENGFFKRPVTAELFEGVLFPANWLRFAVSTDKRIDLLVEIFRQELFGTATYGDLQKRAGAPLLVLNAADMTSGQTFSFTQPQFDLLCSDLSRFSIAEAVAASAAFPAALTPITLRDFSPCDAQRATQYGATLAEDARLNTLEAFYLNPGEGDVGIPLRSNDALAPAVNGTELGRRWSGLRAARLLNIDPTKPGFAEVPRAARKDYLHLLDGGIADNLGLGRPLELLSDYRDRGGIAGAGIKQAVFIVVNARSESRSDLDRTASPPGIIGMALASIGAAIDGRTAGLQRQLELLPQLREDLSLEQVKIVPIDFELIRDEACRHAFQEIGTNWYVDAHVVDALMEMGAAMLRASKPYQEFAASVGGAVRPDAGAEDWAGQARARRACARVDSDRGLPPVRFGNGG